MCGAFLLPRRAEAAAADAVGVVVKGDAVLDEHALREGVARGERERLSLVGGIGELDEDVSLVRGVVIVAVDDADRVVELQAVFEPQPAARVDLEHPAVLDAGADARGDLDRLARRNGQRARRVKIIARTARRGAARQLQRPVDGGAILAEAVAIPLAELRLGNLLKSCNALHLVLSFP